MRAPDKNENNRVAVVGLWHLGTVIAAHWATAGRDVVAIDADPSLVADLRAGRAPIYEPGLDDSLGECLRRGTLRFSSSLRDASTARFVFVAFDTPVLDDDQTDLGVLQNAMADLPNFLRDDAIVIVSSQVPIGTCGRWREILKLQRPHADLVCSPENLQLGRALEAYRKPGHLVIGAEEAESAKAVRELFAEMGAQIFEMNLASAELTKHGINAYLATSVTLANQLANIAEGYGADFESVAAAMKADPRIGSKAYLAPGLGFSGGTLGRDLRALEGAGAKIGNPSPMFAEVLALNASRPTLVRRRLESRLGSLVGRKIGVLGLTYKPGTSTLRRSIPVAVVKSLLEAGAAVQAFDPRADWTNVPVPKGLVLADSAMSAASGTDALVALTAWPEFRDLDLNQIARSMNEKRLFDTVGIFRDASDRKLFQYEQVGAAPPRVEVARSKE